MTTFERWHLREAPAAIQDEHARHGWRIEPTRGGHVRWTHPNGAIVFASSTPSDWRNWANTLSLLRRCRLLTLSRRVRTGGDNRKG